MRAAGSLGLRLGLPLTFAGIYYATRDEASCVHRGPDGEREENLHCSLDPWARALGGALVAEFIDIVVLAHKSVPEKATGFGISPRVVASKNWQGVAVGGVF